MAQRDYESITVADTAIGFTAAKKTNGNVSANKMLVTCETAQVRFRLDGTSPTSSEGHIMNAGDVLQLNTHQDFLGFKAIRTGATSATLKVTYFYGYDE